MQTSAVLTGLTFSAVLAITTSVSGCATDPFSDGACDPSFTTYRITDVQVPDDAAGAGVAALDLDLDGRPDNSLGQTMGLIRSNFGSSEGWESAVVASLADAELAWVLEVERCADGGEGPASVRLMRAQRLADGAVSPLEEGALLSDGVLSDGVITTSYGTGVVPAKILADIRGGQDGWMEEGWMESIAVSAEVFVSQDDTVRGKLGMAMSEELPTVIADPMIEFFNERLSAGTSAFAQLLDANGDGTITFEEFTDSSLIRASLAPDLDLRSETGVYGGELDGQEDSISYGFQFSGRLVEVQ